MPGIPLYPDILRDDHWQKHKGVVAKIIKGETGIGDALKKLKAAHGSVEWQYFDPGYEGPLAKPKSFPELDERLKQSKGKANQLEEFRKLCFSTRDLCKKVGDSWQKNVLIPKSSREHVQQKMTKALEDLALAVKSIDQSGYDGVRKEIEANTKKAREMIAIWVKAIEEGVKKVRANKTTEEFTKSLHQKLRGLGTSIGADPELAAFRSVWGNAGLSNPALMKDCKTPEQFETKLKYVETELAKFKARK